MNTKAQAAYVGTDGDCTLYDVRWMEEESGIDLEIRVRVPRPTVFTLGGGPQYQDHSVAEGMREALRIAAEAAERFAAEAKTK